MHHLGFNKTTSVNSSMRMGLSLLLFLFRFFVQIKKSLVNKQKKGSLNFMLNRTFNRFYNMMNSDVINWVIYIFK